MLDADSVHSYTSLEEKQIVSRIWKKDPSLWLNKTVDIQSNTGWLDSVKWIETKREFFEEFSIKFKDRKFKTVVLIGMGGSSLTSFVLSSLFAKYQVDTKFVVLDTIVASFVESLSQKLDYANTLFIIASKSGKTLETNILYEYFYNQVVLKNGYERAGSFFVAITDNGSDLHTIAKESNFSDIFLNPSDIGGRFSALSYFGIIPALCMGISVSSVISVISKMMDSCSERVSITDNPAINLALYLISNQKNNRNKLTFLFSSSLQSFGYWIEQLIGESLGKDGLGIVPIVEEPVVLTEQYGVDRCFVYYRLSSDKNDKNDLIFEKLKHMGIPVYMIDIESYMDIWAEFFRWKFTVVATSIMLNVNPFDQPDVLLSKKYTNNALIEKLSHPVLFSSDVKSELINMLHNVDKYSYVAILPFLEYSDELSCSIQRLRRVIVSKFGLATVVGYGPKYLHSTGQLFKGGLDSVKVIQIFKQFKEDINIPNYKYTFGELLNAQVMGDFKALKERGREVVLWEITEDAIESIDEITVFLEETV